MFNAQNRLNLCTTDWIVRGTVESEQSREKNGEKNGGDEKKGKKQFCTTVLPTLY